MPIEKPEWWTSDDWSTPQDYFNLVNWKWGPFDLDPAARPETAKAPEFFTKDDDGLSKDWFGAVWCNPPYSDPGSWCQKAIDEVSKGNCRRIVMLLPADISTRWFHNLVLPHAYVQFVKGRLRFIGWQGTPIGSPKAGNILAIYS